MYNEIYDFLTKKKIYVKNSFLHIQQNMQLQLSNRIHNYFNEKQFTLEF